MGEGADHHRVEHARHDDGSIADRLATAQLGVARREEDGLATELDHAGFEGQAGASRGLLEDHAQHAILQRLEKYPTVAQILQLDASADQSHQFVRCVIHHREKVSDAHR